VSKKKTQPEKWRLKPYSRIKMLPVGRPLAPYRAPEIPAGKFSDIPGQMALTPESDDAA
jgi:hypothetical protein